MRCFVSHQPTHLVEPHRVESSRAIVPAPPPPSPCDSSLAPPLPWYRRSSVAACCVRRRNDDDILGVDVIAPLFAMLRSEKVDIRVAALRTMPALVNRAGPLLRLGVGTEENVEALWRLILSKSETEVPTEEEVKAAKEADEEPPGPRTIVTPPPAEQLYYALRTLNAMVFADWQCTSFVFGAPEGAYSMVRDMSPLVKLLAPGGTESQAALTKATRLVQLICRTHFGRKVLLNAGLRDIIIEALRSEDPRLQVICAGIAATVVADEDDTPGEMVDGGVVTTLVPLISSDVLDVQEAATATLGKLVAMSEKAATQCIDAGVLDTVRAVLPAPDRFQTPPSTPLKLEKDNILADAFFGDAGSAPEPEADEAKAENEEIKAPAVPTMGEEEVELPPPLPKSRSTRLSVLLFELLMAMLSHPGTRDVMCMYGGTNAARGLLPSGGHRPTWTQVIMHQVAPASVMPPPEEEENPEGGEGEGEGTGGEGEEAEEKEEAAPAEGEAADTAGGGEGGDATGSDVDAEEDYEPVPIAGDPPSEHNTVCAAALRALEVAARHPRCRAEMLDNSGAGVNTLFACCKAEMQDCVEPALRTLLLIMSYAEVEGNAGQVDLSLVKETMLGIKFEKGTEMLRSALAHALATFPLKSVLPSPRPPTPDPELPRPKIPLRNHRSQTLALRLAVGAHKEAEAAALKAREEEAENADDVLEVVTEK